MMRIDHKVPGGKLIRLEAHIEEGIIKELRITGDFFVHPEEAIIGMETCLLGASVAEARERLDRFIKRERVTLVGMSTPDIIACLERLC